MAKAFCRATGTQRQRGKETSLDFKAQIRGHASGHRAFTGSDVKYSGNEFLNGRTGEIRSMNDFESVKSNHILPAPTDKEGRFLMGPRLQGC